MLILTIDNIALYIATYAELGYLTSNSTAIQLAETAIVAAMNTPQWNNNQGIIKEGEGDAIGENDAIGFKSVLIRYLTKAYPWISDNDIKAAILQYINIQYYALVNLASDDKYAPIR